MGLLGMGGCVYGHLLGYVTVTTFGGGGVKGVRRIVKEGEYAKRRERLSSTHHSDSDHCNDRNDECYITMV